MIGAVLTTLSITKISMATGWVFGETFTPDLALIKLKREVARFHPSLAPICVPPSEDFDDVPEPRPQLRFRSQKMYK